AACSRRWPAVSVGYSSGMVSAGRTPINAIARIDLEIFGRHAHGRTGARVPFRLAARQPPDARRTHAQLDTHIVSDLAQTGRRKLSSTTPARADHASAATASNSPPRKYPPTPASPPRRASATSPPPPSQTAHPRADSPPADTPRATT